MSHSISRTRVWRAARFTCRRFPIGSADEQQEDDEVDYQNEALIRRVFSACFRIRWPAATAATATRSQSRSSLGSAVNTLKHLERSCCWVSRLVRRVPDATERRDRDTTRIPPPAERTCPTPTRLPRIDRSAMDPTSRCVFHGLFPVVVSFLQTCFSLGIYMFNTYLRRRHAV